MAYRLIKTDSMGGGAQSTASFRNRHLKLSLSEKRNTGCGIPLDMRDDSVWVSDRENHCLICGASGLGKTRRVLYPAVLLAARASESMIIADMKGEIFRNTAAEVKRCGHDIKVINLREPARGNSYNPFSLVEKAWYEGKHDRAEILLKDISRNITASVSSAKDRYWETSMQDAFTGFALMILEGNRYGSLSFSSIKAMFDEYMSFGDDERRNVSSAFFRDTDSYRRLSTLLSLTSDQTLSCIYSVFNAAVSPFTDQEDIRAMLSESDVDLSSIGSRPTAVYIICPDESTSLYNIASLFVEQAYSELITSADSCDSHRLDVNVSFILDEFGSFVGSDWASKLTAARSRGIRFYLAIQAMSQIIGRYGEYGARTIMSNCRTIIYMGGRDTWLMQELSYLGGVKDGIPVLSVNQLLKLGDGKILVLDDSGTPYFGKLCDWEAWKVKEMRTPRFRKKEDKKPSFSLIDMLDQNMIEVVPF